jgi:hypothetical protein
MHIISRRADSQREERRYGVDIAEILRRAIETVDDAGVPDDLRPAAFSAVVSLLTGQVPINGKPEAAKVGGTLLGAPGDDDPLTRIATALSVDIETVKSIYHDTGSDLDLVVSNSKLPTQKAVATREIALLVTAGRQLGGYDDEYTSLEHIRRQCEEHKRLDGPNFTKALVQFEPLTLKGKGRSRAARLSRPGREQARELILRLSGAES